MINYNNNNPHESLTYKIEFKNPENYTVSGYKYISYSFDCPYSKFSSTLIKNTVNHSTCIFGNKRLIAEYAAVDLIDDSYNINYERKKCIFGIYFNTHSGSWSDEQDPDGQESKLDASLKEIVNAEFPDEFKHSHDMLLDALRLEFKTFGKLFIS
jgi:hypothetical protein